MRYPADSSETANDGAPRRRILVASYHYPPDAAVGALRAAKFTRFLAEAEWQPYVLTTRDAFRESGTDPDRLRGLEKVPVLQVGEFPRIIEGGIRLLRFVTGRSAKPAISNPVERLETSDRRERLGARLKRYVVSLFVLLPDEKKNWSLYAALVAPRVIRRHRLEWVFTSGPPFSNHVIGVVARLLTKARWVADFRDPWVDMLPDRFPFTRSRLSDSIERWMEFVVVRLADRVTTTTNRMLQAMSSRYPRVPGSKFVCIPNSIDPDRLRRDNQVTRFDRLTITYAGSLYFDRNPEPLFHAAGELIRSGHCSAADIRIVLVGLCRSINGTPTEVVVKRHGLEDVVEVRDPVPYEEAVRIMQRSHLLLVLAPERHRLVIPAKVYDYLGTGSMVLALAEPGATADLMEETQCGACFSHRDIGGIRDYLARLLADRRYQTMRNRPELFARYDARALTARLIGEMGRVESSARHEVTVQT